MNRSFQAAVWIPLAFALGAMQALASFATVMLWRGDLGSRDLHRLLPGLALVYGGGWFLPALLISDFFLIRRALSHREFARYVLVIAISALVVGLVLPGMMIMIGYPATAAAIVIAGFTRRKQRAGQ